MWSTLHGLSSSILLRHGWGISNMIKVMGKLEDKLKEVKTIRKKLKDEGCHQPLNWEQVKKAITYNWKEQEKYDE